MGLRSGTGFPFLSFFFLSFFGVVISLRLQHSTLNITVIMQNTPLGRHNLQNTSVFENYSNYPRNKMKIIRTTPAQNEIIQITPAQIRATTQIQTTPAQNDYYSPPPRYIVKQVQLDT